MPVYHFNISDGRPEPDLRGTELPDLQVARREAIRLLGEVLRDKADEFWADGRLTLTITDDEGLTLVALETFSVESPTVRRSQAGATSP
jgi:hypothetical protein